MDVLALTAPAYGGDWNPEQYFDQWGRAQTLERDITLMREAGVTLVTLGVFAWSRLEPREGRYDLDWMEEVLDRCHEAGIMVDLATGTASPPAWMATDHPDTLPVRRDGVRLCFGSRQQFSPSSATYRRAAVGLATAMARRFGTHPALVMWHVGNEYGCHVRECFSEESRAAFRAWLAQRHGSIEALNCAWGTDFWSQRYTDFSQVDAPGEMPTFHNPAQALDWLRFNDHQLRSLYLAEAEAIRAHSSAPVMTNLMGAFPALDYRRWAPHLDLVADDSYPDPADPAAAHELAFAGDLMRGLAGGGSWMLMEQAPSAVQWRARNSPKRPGQFLLWSLARLAHGADALLQFQWRQSSAGSETFHSGMVPHAGADSRTWSEVVHTGQVLSRLGEVVGTRVEAEAAVVLDWESQWARHACIGPTEEQGFFTGARAWHRSLWEAGHQVDVVGVEDDLSTYRLVVVPEIFIDRPEFTRKLEQAVAGGAQVVVAGPSGVVDETGRAILGGYLGSLRELLGVSVTDHAALTGPAATAAHEAPQWRRGEAVHRLTRAVGAPGALTWVGLEANSEPLRRALERLGSPAPDLRAGMWAEEVRLLERAPGEGPTAQVVAFFDGRGAGVDLAGRAAVTRRAHEGGGGGAAWYVACDLDALSRAALLDVLAAHARVRPVIAGLPDGVEASRRANVLFLLNHGDRAVELGGIVGTDLVSGAECTGHVLLTPRSGMVVRQR
ncbi:beta-galactosidase [Schaalia sp. 19OD2882]|uniref:beta-galactosidase n=1 Tax=Schaalia sp. 19OD2882 TaxID=2794089 RepID=UPI001C1E9F49|nr:beta-galactosidase [Schaalia sp. 19OD2882]QWW20748.1 beta-galactosidase [Schaalia sp. 19OD2882]